MHNPFFCIVLEGKSLRVEVLKEASLCEYHLMMALLIIILFISRPSTDSDMQPGSSNVIIPILPLIAS